MNTKEKYLENKEHLKYFPEENSTKQALKTKPESDSNSKKNINNG